MIKAYLATKDLKSGKRISLSDRIRIGILHANKKEQLKIEKPKLLDTPYLDKDIKRDLKEIIENTYYEDDVLNTLKQHYNIPLKYRVYEEKPKTYPNQLIKKQLDSINKRRQELYPYIN